MRRVRCHKVEEVDDGDIEVLFRGILTNRLVEKSEEGGKIRRGGGLFVLLFKSCFDGLEYNGGLESRG